MSAEQSGRRDEGPTDIDLANYARTYIGAYMDAVKGEGPEHPPSFFKNQPYAIEVCYMPNESFCLLFEKSDRSTIAVTSQDWDHVMSKVMSGVSYLATVYPHEGFTVDDAASKGKRDAIRDIRAIESSEMVDATRQLEKVIGELSDIGEWMKNPVRMAETALAKLEPIKQAVLKGGPTVDMLAAVDGLRRYKPGPANIVMDPEDLESLSEVASQVTELTTMLRDVKLQGEKLEDVEEHLRGELHDFKIELDKKVAKGLGVILATTDRKIDKALASSPKHTSDAGLQEVVESLSQEVGELKESMEQLQAAEPETEEDDMASRFAELVEEVATVRSMVENIRMPELPVMPEPRIPDKMLAEMEALRGDVSRFSLRVKRIEDYLTAVSASRRANR